MIYLFCFSDPYAYFEDYINSLKQVFEFTLIKYTKENVKTEFDKIYNITSKIIFMQRIPDIILTNLSANNNVYVINMEQLTNSNWLIDAIKNILLNYNDEVKYIDYSIGNAKIAQKLYPERKIYVLPYNLNYNEISDKQKTKNICIINPESQYRLNLIKTMQNAGSNIDIVKGFGKERDDTLFKYKILLNISFLKDKYKIMETIRCDRCIYNKMIIISDIKDDSEDYYLKDHIIYTEPEKIYEVLCDVNNNYDKYYDKLFGNFNYEEIDNKIKLLSNDLLNDLIKY